MTIFKRRHFFSTYVTYIDTDPFLFLSLFRAMAKTRHYGKEMTLLSLILRHRYYVWLLCCCVVCTRYSFCAWLILIKRFHSLYIYYRMRWHCFFHHRKLARSIPSALIQSISLYFLFMLSLLLSLSSYPHPPTPHTLHRNLVSKQSLRMANPCLGLCFVMRVLCA